MKRFIHAISLCLLLCIGLVSCNQSNSNNNTIEHSNSDHSTEKPQYYVPSQSQTGLLTYQFYWGKNVVDIYLHDELISHREYDNAGNEISRIDYPRSYDSDVCEYWDSGIMRKRTSFDLNGNISKCYEYTTNGLLSKITSYKTDGSLDTEIIYNEYGDEIENTAYGNKYSDGIITLKKTITYIDKGSPFREVISLNGEACSMYEYEYDINGNITKVSSINLSTMNTNYYTIYSYNDHSDLSMTTSYDSNGGITGYTRYEYTYNDHGSYTKIVATNSDGNQWTYGEFEYDADNNLINYVYYESNGSVSSKANFKWETASEAQRNYYFNYIKGHTA